MAKRPTLTTTAGNPISDKPSGRPPNESRSKLTLHGQRELAPLPIGNNTVGARQAVIGRTRCGRFG
jgi:hypothetical protein